MKLEKGSWIAAILAIPVAFLVWLVTPTEFIGFCKSLGKTISTPFASMFSWLTHPVTWPMWVLIVVVLAVLFVLIATLLLYSLIRKGGRLPEIDPVNYRTDEIFGVVWIWSYIYGKLDQNNISAICPRQDCKHRLETQINPNAPFNPALRMPPVSLVCRRCGFKKDFNSDLKSVEYDVLLEVDRRIRTGEFVRRLTNIA